jgi:general secretion pathway protein A
MMNDSQQNATIEPGNLPPARIYQEYYHLTEPPFAITPDPEFLFFSSNHRQVLDKITYAIECRMGFILLTGEVGTGKTTLCRTLLDRLEEKAKTVYIINPSISGQELLAGILEDLGVSTEPDASKKELTDQLNLFLLADESHTPTVVIIDDAQTMSPETLEDLRLLSNLETDKQKLLQVVLSGQSELLERLESQNLRQLRQRIAIHCNLIPLPAQETEAYIYRRLSVAGNKGQVRFSPSATQRIHKSSDGIPRHINKICDYALTAGYVKDDPVIDCSHVKRALTEIGGTTRKKPRFYGATIHPVRSGFTFSGLRRFFYPWNRYRIH